MSARTKPGTRVLAVLLVSILCAIALAEGVNPFPLRPRSVVAPLPYRVARYPGGIALRLAMVHDVLHERYLVHGAAWNRQCATRAAGVWTGEVIGGRSRSPEAFDAMDDLAVACIRLHQEGWAEELMREKLARLPKGTVPPPAPVISFAQEDDQELFIQSLQTPPLTPTEHQLYTAHANLGTALIHASFAQAMAGDTAAAGRLRDGLRHIEWAMTINPRAHFGREKWQAIAVRHFLVCRERPEFAARYTLTGSVLEDRRIGLSVSVRSPFGVESLVGVPDEEIDPDRRNWFRHQVTGEQMDDDWAKAVGVEQAAEIPFDEPVLAIIGMWTLGGGPNAHFALALGRLMDNVNERQLAWNGYERAVELAGIDGRGFSRDAGAAASMIAYCRRRQESIAAEESGDPGGWQKTMRRRHQAELAWGLAYQGEYQAYEAQRIGQGSRMDDPHAYDAFFQSHGRIASDPGHADDAIVTHTAAGEVGDVVPVVVLCMGVFLWVDIVYQWWRKKREGRCVPKAPMSRLS